MIVVTNKVTAEIYFLFFAISSGIRGFYGAVKDRLQIDDNINFKFRSFILLLGKGGHQKSHTLIDLV